MGVFAGVDLDGLVLRGARLTLRPWAADDAEAVFAIMQDPSMREFLALPDPYTRAVAREFVTTLGDEGRREGTGLGCAVVETGTDRVVGSAAIRLSGQQDVGYWIAPAARGRGYAAEATRVLAEWGLAHGLRAVRLRCDVRNLASVRTALAAGFRHEGVLREFRHHPLDRSADERVSDLALFARTASDSGDPVAPAFARLPREGLGDGVLALRALQPDDASAFFEQESDPVTVAIGFSGVGPAFDAVRRLADRAGLEWLVGQAAALTMVDTATGRFAGSVRLRLAGPPGVGGIGYAVHPAFRGRGYTTRALKLLIPWAFEHGGFARLELGAKTGNLASLRAAAAAGFEPDGVRAARLRNPDGTFTDEVRYALINPAITRSGTVSR